jgi:hypothetical protein
MKKLIKVLIVCGLFVVMGGTASGETLSKEIISCSKIKDTLNRLNCYDKISKHIATKSGTSKNLEPNIKACKKFVTETAIDTVQAGYDTGSIDEGQYNMFMKVGKCEVESCKFYNGGISDDEFYNWYIGTGARDAGKKLGCKSEMELLMGK